MIFGLLVLDLILGFMVVRVKKHANSLNELDFSIASSLKLLNLNKDLK